MNTTASIRLAALTASAAVTTVLLLAIALFAYPAPDTETRIAQSPVTTSPR